MGRRLPLMARARSETSSRLSVDDWIQAGFAILAEEGIKALKIDRLCRRLGVTKGSFYWHFTDIARYRADEDAAASVRAADQRVLAAVRARPSWTTGSTPKTPTCGPTPLSPQASASCTSRARSPASARLPAARASSRSCSSPDRGLLE